LEGDAPEDNESSEKSPQIPLPTHGEMTLEVEGEEKGTCDVSLADNSSVTRLDKVIEQALMPEKDSEEIVNKNEGANELKRSLDEKPEPTEADSTDSAKTDGTILCHEELSAKGNDEDNAKYEQNEINKVNIMKFISLCLHQDGDKVETNDSLSNDIILVPSSNP